VDEEDLAWDFLLSIADGQNCFSLHSEGRSGHFFTETRDAHPGAFSSGFTSKFVQGMYATDNYMEKLMDFGFFSPSINSDLCLL
jgi:hypothetical protein